MRKIAVVVLLLSLLLSACSTTVSGRKQVLLVPEGKAIAASATAYEETIAEYKQDNKLNRNRQAYRRIKAITDRLIKQAVAMRSDSKDWQWEVNVVTDPQVNAWCMAGGKMVMYTGLLDAIKPTDDELAQVMAHEISHALANHSAERMSVAVVSSVGLSTLGAITDSELSMTAAAVAAKYALELPNSRSGESEADQIGIELAAKAGFNPNAAVSLWKKMGALSSNSTPEFMSTHPSPDTRQEDLRKLANQVRPYYLAAKDKR